ncbi:hypothetical protein FSP39_003557 [Pinctada imbricata]|uniref:Glutaredoxin domain-containing protein n=1 Tax=Pinctada imbricata TaxID=66713 RepID=A0AA88XTB6_PINIB|nr:hypothetical protein FSP39_003557 [Pinctada imbricata]
MAGAKIFVDKKLAQKKVLLFSKTYSPECKSIKAILDTYKLTPNTLQIVEIETRQDCTQIENYFQILCSTDARAVPQLFIGGRYVGGEKEIPRLHEAGKLGRMIYDSIQENKAL